MNATIAGAAPLSGQVLPRHPLQSALLGDTGLADDRHWMLVRPNGRFVTQRELPRLALIGTAVERGRSARSRLPACRRCRWRGHAAGEALRRDGVEVHGQRHRLRRDRPRPGARNSCRRRCGWCASMSGSRANATPSGPRVLARSPSSRTAFPILVISRASLAELNSAGAEGLADGALPAERGHRRRGAYDEDRIHELHADEVTLRLVKPCTRCSITTTDQQIGAVDGVEPLATLKTYRYDRELRGVHLARTPSSCEASARVCESECNSRCPGKRRDRK